MKDVTERKKLTRLATIVAFAGVVTLITRTGWGDGAFDSLTEQGLMQKIGNVFKLAGGILGPIVAVGCIAKASFSNLVDHNHDEMVGWLKKAVFGGGLGLGCWALGKLLISTMQ